MAREYRHLKVYEKEILELREQGLTQREIASRFGVSYRRCVGHRKLFPMCACCLRQQLCKCPTFALLVTQIS